MTKLEMWVACWLTRRLVRQGRHRQRITNLFVVVRAQCEFEFPEDSRATLSSFLYECFDDAMGPKGLTTTREALQRAMHILRSYQYGNAATEPAKDMADRIDVILAAANAAEAKPEPVAWIDDDDLRLLAKRDKRHYASVCNEQTAACKNPLFSALPVPMDAQPIKAKDCNIETFSQSDVDGYVRHLTWCVWNAHYREKSPNFELLPDTVGVLTQLDNMLTGWKAVQPVADNDGSLSFCGGKTVFEYVPPKMEHDFDDDTEQPVSGAMDAHSVITRILAIPRGTSGRIIIEQSDEAWIRAALSSNQVNAAQPAKDAYNELIYAVGKKYPNETRHETALRYILQAEQVGISTAQKSAAIAKQSDN